MFFVDKRVAHKGPATSTTEPPGNLETDNNYELSQHETRPRKPLHPPPVLNEAELPTSADQGVVAFSPSGTQSPPQAVFDQQVRDGQDEATLNQPNLPSKNSHTKAQKVALLPKLDLRRSRSAAEVVNLFHTNTTQTPVLSNTAQPPDEILTSSSEYPYVVRTCEAIEKDRVIVGSLPNILQFHSSNLKLRLRQEDENTSNDVVPYASVRVDGSDADFHDDEPTYSYTDSRELMQNGTINGKDNNFHYEEYPSEWMHVAQEHTEPAADSNNCQSPDYQDIDNFDDLVPTKSQSASALPSSNLASPLKISGAKENSTLPLKGKPKPPIQPRRKQTQTIVPSTPATQLSRIGTNNPSSADKIVNSADLNAQTPNKYMKLLPSTMDNFQVYTCLQNGTNDADLEQANPNQSSEN